MLIPKILVSGRNSNTKLVNMAKFKIRLAGVPDILINVHASLPLAGRFLYTSVGDLRPRFHDAVWTNLEKHNNELSRGVWLTSYLVILFYCPGSYGSSKTMKVLKFSFQKIKYSKVLKFSENLPNFFTLLLTQLSRDIKVYTCLLFYV